MAHATSDYIGQLGLVVAWAHKIFEADPIVDAGQSLLRLQPDRPEDAFLARLIASTAALDALRGG